MPPFAGPSVMLYCTRYPVNTSISPLSIWIGHDTVICRFGCVRIFQTPGSRPRRRAAPSNSWSIALKMLPAMCIDATVPETGKSSRRGFGRRRREHADRVLALGVHQHAQHQTARRLCNVDDAHRRSEMRVLGKQLAERVRCLVEEGVVEHHIALARKERQVADSCLNEVLEEVSAER